MANQTSTEIQVAPFGDVYLAPVGTAVPANPVETLNVAWKKMGYVSEDGVKLTPSVDVEKKKAWQALFPVKTLITGANVQIKFKLLQTNEQSLETYFFFADDVNSSGYGSMAVSSNIADQNRALLIEFQNEAAKQTRIIFPSVLLSDREELSLQRTEILGYGLTFEVNDYNGTLMYVRSQIPELVPTT